MRLSGASFHFYFFINQNGKWCLSNINCSIRIYTKVCVHLKTVKTVIFEVRVNDASEVLGLVSICSAALLTEIPFFFFKLAVISSLREK